MISAIYKDYSPLFPGKQNKKNRQRKEINLTEMKPEFFVAIDFDGTVTPVDITDAVIKKFAGPGWEEAEEQWENGLIGSRECLERQICLIDAPVDRLLQYIDGFSIDRHFTEFIGYLKCCNIPFAIISDGFRVFAERLLKNSGLESTYIYANELIEINGRLRALFPNSNEYCYSGTCKCVVARYLSKGLPIMLIGDGRSDFGLAGKAAHVFSKGKLSVFCESRGISYTPFNNFMDMKIILKDMSSLISQFV